MVSIPRPLMFAANLAPGTLVIWELLEDGSLRLREWRDTVMAQTVTPGIFGESPLPVKR